jgi:hypothetical protein
MMDLQKNNVLNKSKEKSARGVLVLEIAFLGAVLIMVLAALWAAFGYKIVSARTPFVIMAPLILLIILQFWRLFREQSLAALLQSIPVAFTERGADFNKTLSLSGWLVALGLIIWGFGHYIGISLFMFLLMKIAAKQKLLTSLIISVGATAVIYITFKVGFSIELYRGLLFRYMAGYNDF